MPNETAVDALRRKGWVRRDDGDDDMVAADDAREAAAKTTGRRRSPLYDHPTSEKKGPSAVDYFKAGAKDFVEDVKSSISGESKGPSMKHRKKLTEEED